MFKEGREEVSLSVKLGQVRTLEEYPAGAGSDSGSSQWGNDSNGVKKKILWLAVPGSAKIEGGDSDGNSVSEAGDDSASCSCRIQKGKCSFVFLGLAGENTGIVGNLGLDIFKHGKTQKTKRTKCCHLLLQRGKSAPHVPRKKGAYPVLLVWIHPKLRPASQQVEGTGRLWFPVSWLVRQAATQGESQSRHGVKWVRCC